MARIKLKKGRLLDAAQIDDSGQVCRRWAAIVNANQWSRDLLAETRGMPAVFAPFGSLGLAAGQRQQGAITDFPALG